MAIASGSISTGMLSRLVALAIQPALVGTLVWTNGEEEGSQ
ncbi:hypothetical protein [Thermoleptolyngbya sichuanensis]|nr:hypothetical protein [Thermoleptolyngbya sichuanensis]